MVICCMPRAGLLLVLTFSGCLFGAYAADLSCIDIQEILSGYQDCPIHPCNGNYGLDELNRKWWNFGPDRTYRNRDCDKCHLNHGGADCKDNSCPHMGGPVGTAVDVLPSDSDLWICPAFCGSMPEIPIKFTFRKTVSEWMCIGVWAALSLLFSMGSTNRFEL